jgi:hypothetical protein
MYMQLHMLSLVNPMLFRRSATTYVVALARFSGDPKYYQIVNALCGMKIASADYQHAC